MMKKSNIPYPHLIFENFLDKKEVVEYLVALKKEKFMLKEADLFTFWQSLELVNNIGFKVLIKNFRTDDWMRYIIEQFGIMITHKIDLFGSLYKKTNHLLPHDDQLEGRKIAFILFLNTLPKKQGGSLQLFKENKLVKKIQPKSGRLVLFEVSSNSVHSIEEVYSGQRWALTGWFHG